MKGEVWTLTKATVAREAGEDGKPAWPLREEHREFRSFEEARDAFRRLARECATREDGVFDGDGNIRSLREYFDLIAESRESQMRDPEPNHMLGSKILRGAPDEAYMAGDFEGALAVPAALRAWLLDMAAHDSSPLPEFRWTDWALGIVSRRDSFAMGAISSEERIELYDAQVYTNAFDMSDPDGDYELSVRAGFDPYDQDAGALRIRLVRGPAKGGGHHVWPEEADGWPPYREPAPCIEGAFDGNGYITVFVRPERDGEETLSDEVAGGYEGFVDDVAALGEAAGLVADVSERRSDPDGEWANARIGFYRAEGDGCWFELRFGAHYEYRLRELAPPPAHLGIEPRKRDDPPIRVDGSSSERPVGARFEGYPEALAEVGRLIGEHVRRIDDPTGRPDNRPEKVLFFNIVCELGEGE